MIKRAWVVSLRLLPAEGAPESDIALRQQGLGRRSVEASSWTSTARYTYCRYRCHLVELATFRQQKRTREEAALVSASSYAKEEGAVKTVDSRDSKVNQRPGGPSEDRNVDGAHPDPAIRLSGHPLFAKRLVHKR